MQDKTKFIISMFVLIVTLTFFVLNMMSVYDVDSVEENSDDVVCAKVFDDCTDNRVCYEEINWAEQTYNVVSDCRDLDNMNIPVLYYNDDKKQFYCIEKNNCDEEGCKYKERYLDPIIQK